MRAVFRRTGLDVNYETVGSLHTPFPAAGRLDTRPALEEPADTTGTSSQTELTNPPPDSTPKQPDI
ncbi:hypothetical protein, partial [Pseudonocardia sulfidoxydans]